MTKTGKKGAARGAKATKDASGEGGGTKERGLAGTIAAGYGNRSEVALFGRALTPARILHYPLLRVGQLRIHTASIICVVSDDFFSYRGHGWHAEKNGAPSSGEGRAGRPGSCAVHLAGEEYKGSGVGLKDIFIGLKQSCELIY